MGAATSSSAPGSSSSSQYQFDSPVRNDYPPPVQFRKVLPEMPSADKQTAEVLRHFAEKHGRNLDAQIRKAKAVTPPPLWQEFLRLRGDCDVDLDDPDFAEYLKPSK
eukprot:TRINITY_DN3417_c0_g2_i1.p2 TRINITY_DN3417_c0_g2~~TRINITY_DN3417_c0_g2_i1.p2  ORF type:complete len:107 (+),score=21.50 TRINITY_DN3417_c0_g2_i1:463-783(+)